MLPKRGVLARQVVGQLGDLLMHAGNLPRTVDSTAYVAWAQNVERELRRYFDGVPIERLFTERFWKVQGPDILHRSQMLDQEREVQVAWLSELRDTVETMAARFDTPSRSIGVLDTNVLLHHKPLTDVPWTTIVGGDQVLLVVPRRVVEEMDTRKYAGTKLGDRARTRTGLLARCLERETDQVRRGVDVEIVASVDLDPDAARRPPIPTDEEVIETCEALTSYAGSNPVCLVTGDLNMQTLAQSRAVDVQRMPDDTMQRLGSGD